MFVVLGLHADLASAERLVDDRTAAAPWLDEAAEIWSGVLQPFRHKGKASYLTPGEPDKFLDPLAEPPPAKSPTVVLTSSAGTRTASIWHAWRISRWAPAPFVRR